jgi:uncharacterized membrane protein
MRIRFFAAPVGVALTIAACSEVSPTAVPDLARREARSGGDSVPVVSSVKPNKSLRGTTLDVRVFGSGFDQGSTVQLALDGVATDEVVTNSTTYVNSHELIANVTISADAEGALYDVIVTSSSGKPGIGTESFEVTVEMTLLPTLGETTQAGATGINEAGDISGYAYLPGSGGRAMLWTRGVPRNLGVLAGFDQSRAEGLNNRGQVVGYAMAFRDGKWKSKAFVWSRESGMQPLMSPGDSRALAINDAGMVIGNATDETGRWRVTVWINGVPNYLPRQAFTAYDINARGEVVGAAAPFDVAGELEWSSAYIWSAQEGFRYLNTLQGSLGEPLGINDNGDVVGWGPAADGPWGYGFVIRRGVAQNLAATGGESSVGFKIAGNGLVVGRGQNTAAIWSVNGTMLLLPTPIGGTYVEALDMNSRGEAVGSVQLDARNGFEQRAIKWRVY